MPQHAPTRQDTPKIFQKRFDVLDLAFAYAGQKGFKSARHWLDLTKEADPDFVHLEKAEKLIADGLKQKAESVTEPAGKI